MKAFDASPLKKYTWLPQYKFIFSLMILLIVIFAITSDTFYHPDEHFQTLEFMNHLFYHSPGTNLPWEFAAKIRPWFQPMVYGVISQALDFISVTSVFMQIKILRLFTGLLSSLSLICFCLVAGRWFKSERLLLVCIGVVCLLACTPYLAVRTSSEAFSTAFFLIGFCLLIQEHEVPAGLLFGLAIQSRYQTGVMVIATLGWFLFHQQNQGRRVFKVLSAVFVTAIFGLGLDRIGYGEWTLTPLNYFRENLIKGISKNFGVEHWYFFFEQLGLTVPLGAVLIPVALAALYFCADHVLAWAVIPMIAIHFLIAHKELRFLFITLAPILVIAFIALDRQIGEERIAEYLKQHKSFKVLFVVGILFNFVCMIQIALDPLSSYFSFRARVDGLLPKGQVVYTMPSVEKFESTGKQKYGGWRGALRYDIFKRASIDFRRISELKQQTSIPQYTVFWWTQGLPASLLIEPLPNCKFLIESPPHFLRHDWLRYFLDLEEAYSLYTCPPPYRK